jgi:uncharacterized RDD family membrane protein YckC
MTTVSVQTTQNVHLEYPTATLGDRVLASLLDRVIMIVYVVVMQMIIARNVIGETNRVIFVIIAMLPALFYTLLQEIFLNGQTIGKIALQTRVIRLDGREPTIGNYALRWLLRIVDVWLMFGVFGFIAIAVSPLGQRLGDMAAGTTVIRLRRRSRAVDNFANSVPVENTYVPVFPQAEQLSDKHASIIHEVIRAYQKEHNYEAVDRLSNKLKELLRIETGLPPFDFLKALLNDYVNLHGAG